MKKLIALLLFLSASLALASGPTIVGKSGSLTGGLATSDTEGSVKSNTFEIKRVDGNKSSTGVLTDLTYTLEPGKTYRITLILTAIGVGRIVVKLKDGATEILRVDDAGGTSYTSSVIRTIVDGTLTFDATSLGSNIEGDINAKYQTHAIVETLENYTEGTL